MFETLQQFGVEWPKFVTQLLLLVIVVTLLVRAITTALKVCSGVELPLWVLISLLFPIIGPIVTLIALRGRKSKCTDAV